MRAAVAALATDEETDASSIEAQLAPLLGTARGHFLFLERGGVGLLHARLKEAGARFSGLLPWCRLLALCCRDEESAVALGLLGGHRWLLDMEGAHDEEEEEAAEAVVECAAEIAGRCSVVRGGFPLRQVHF